LRSVHLGERPWIVGHRGAAPEIENSLAAFAHALHEGADAVECDVQATRDGVLVVFHDETLARFFPGEARPVSDLTRDEIRDLVLTPPRAADEGEGGGIRLGQLLRRASIATLDELLAALPDSFPVNVEVKTYSGWNDRLVETLLQALHGRGNVFVSSFDRRLLGHLRRAAPELPLSVLADRIDDELVDLAGEIDAWAFHLGVTPPVARLARLGRPVLVYTVNEPALARRLVGAGAAGLFTDRPGALRSALGLPVPGSRGFGPPPSTVV
jgi:glycerophosphoryl diester phosphodiesterase